MCSGGLARSSKALSVFYKLWNWWTSCFYEGMCLAYQAWFASTVRTPMIMSDVGIGDGQFLHTLSMAASPAALLLSLALAVLHGYGQGIWVWA